MLRSSIGYLLRHPTRIAVALHDPLETWTTLHDRWVERGEKRGLQCEYQAEPSWEPILSNLLGPQETATTEFWELWPKVIGEMEAHGIRVGPESFKGWNDGDAGLVRAIWCLVRYLRPVNVVETGVAHGVTSRFILEALKKNGAGHLWSIDHPPLEEHWHTQIGIAVGDGFPDRWSYIKGSSRRRLPALLSRLGQIDLFVHDSLHSTRNVRFEMERAWAALRPGGALVVDDIDANGGFKWFQQSFSGHCALICEAEPLRPDLRRLNHKGLFGIVLKDAADRRYAQ